MNIQKMQSIPWIDVHTHRRVSVPGVLSVLNVFSGENIPGDNFFSVGTNPWNVKDKPVPLPQSKVLTAPNCLAVGETGMDKAKAFAPYYELQKEVFLQHLKLAKQYRKPLIIHCVRCYDEIVRKTENFPYPKIIHGFSRNAILAGQLIDKGFYLSFGALLLNSSAKVREAIKSVPLDRIFLETDDSGISILEIYSVAAEILGISKEDLKSRIYENFRLVFGLKK